MACNCNKNKFEINPEDAPKQLKNAFSTKLGMIASFAQAIVSRGLTNKKIETPVKQLRVLSCFGNEEYGGKLTPCEHLKPSQTVGKFYCGGCGCGDKPRTWLMGTGEEYSKLDYPKLNCPLKMPGFSNYESSKLEEQQNSKNRKFYIENMNFVDVHAIKVSAPSIKSPPDILQ